MRSKHIQVIVGGKLYKNAEKERKKILEAKVLMIWCSLLMRIYVLKESIHYVLIPSVKMVKRNPNAGGSIYASLLYYL